MLKKWVYGLIIAVVWVTGGLISVSFTLVTLFEKKYSTLFTHALP